MIKIGDYNTLKISRMVDFGAYLDAGDGKEVLIPAKFLDDDARVGDDVRVFVFLDSEDRLIATTEHPYATVGEFAYLEVAQVNKFGAFLDWGLESKQLLVPYSEQKVKMMEGGIYLVYIYLDDATKRVVASARIERHLGNVLPRYRRGDKVKALVVEHTALGYRCIVDNLHWGMVYSNQLYEPLELQQEIEVFVSNVRPDGKIDLTLGDRADRRTEALADRILASLTGAGGILPLSDKSSPEAIAEMFACSKKDFKKAVGHLFKQHKILVFPTSIRLNK